MFKILKKCFFSEKIKFNDHYPVMYREILDLLENSITQRNFSKDQSIAIADLTLGLGNHSKLILEKFPNAFIVGLDIDNKMIEKSTEKLNHYIENEERMKIIQDSYVTIRDHKPYDSFPFTFHPKRKYDFIFADLGYNSVQIEDENKGMSFKFPDSILDMRYDQDNDNKPMAYEILNNSSELELLEIFRKYGEEPYFLQLVKNIIAHRQDSPFYYVKDFLKVIDKTFSNKDVSKFNAYTRLFQALRIVVNYEFLNIQRMIQRACVSLEVDGIFAAISFHSLEDKIVKNAFREYEKNKLGERVSEAELKPSSEEVEENPRSKSAKLRAFRQKSKI